MSEIQLKWQSSARGAVETIVYRDTSPFDKGTAAGREIATLPGNPREYVDTTVENGNDYYYRIGVRLASGGDVVVSDAIYHTTLKFNYYTFHSTHEVIKLDHNWNVAWECRVGENLYCGDVSETGIIYAGDNVGSIHKVSPEGELLWTQSLNNVNGTNAGRVYGLCVGLSGNVYAGGNNDAVCKVSPEGEILWNHPTTTTIFDVVTDSQENVYAAYGTRIVKLDSNGNVIWDISAASTVYGLAVDRNFNVYTTEGATGVILVKYDPNGVELWRVSTSDAGGGSTVNQYSSLALMTDGSIIICASTLYVKVSKDGAVLATADASDMQYLHGSSLDGTFYGKGAIANGGIIEYDANLTKIRELDLGRNDRDKIIQPSNPSVAYGMVVDPGMTRIMMDAAHVTA